MKIYHLKTCDTCRKALKSLQDQGPTLVEIRQDGVPPETLKIWLDTLGDAVLINRRSTTWRNLSEAERAGNPLELLQKHPTLLKRPVIEAGGEVYVGWSAATQAALGVS